MCLIKIYSIKETQSSPFYLRGLILSSRFYFYELIFDVTVNIQTYFRLFIFFEKPISNEKNDMLTLIFIKKKKKNHRNT